MLTALIVEDEPLMREYLLFNLSSIHDQWITAACAKDGVEAMALLNEQHFDLIITDIKMPRMTGVELATYVHNNIADTDIIFLTGYDEFDYARAAVRSGVSDYLLKPLQDAELHAILDKLAKKRSAGETRQANSPSEGPCFSGCCFSFGRCRIQCSGTAGKGLYPDELFQTYFFERSRKRFGG